MAVVYDTVDTVTYMSRKPGCATLESLVGCTDDYE